jgi:hypothetical protein
MAGLPVAKFPRLSSSQSGHEETSWEDSEIHQKPIKKPRRTAGVRDSIFFGFSRDLLRIAIVF